MSNEQIWMTLREFILKQQGPFCLLNLYIRAEKQLGITDQRLIDKVLDEVYQEGNVEYREITPPPKDPESATWAFYVV